MTRTVLHTAAAIGAATALTVAGAGAASAATSKIDRSGDSITVTFTLDAAQTEDNCGAVLVPSTALSVLDGVDLDNPSFDSLLGNIEALKGVIALKNDSGLTVTLNATNPTGTVTAENVPSGLYALGAFCTSDMDDIQEPTDLLENIDPILVGSPLDAISGLSSGGGLNTLSALAGGGDGTGAIGLDTLSAGFGADDTEN